MSKLILIVDDEPNVRLNYRTALETEGALVLEAKSGATALALLEENQFDLVISDLRMPEMDGIAMLAAMRERGFKTPTIIITAYGDIPDVVRAMRLGAIDFLKKPMTPESLRAVVKSVLDRHAPEPPTEAAKKEDFETEIGLAKRLLNLQDFARAKVHLVRALELKSNAEAFNLAGVFFEMQEDYERAKKHYGQAIKLDKHYEPAQQNMRRIYELFHFGSSQEPFNIGEN